MQQLDQAQTPARAAKAGVAFLLGAQEPATQLELDIGALQYRPGAALGTFDALYQAALESRPDLKVSTIK